MSEDTVTPQCPACLETLWRAERHRWVRSRTRQHFWTHHVGTWKLPELTPFESDGRIAYPVLPTVRGMPPLLELFSRAPPDDLVGPDGFYISVGARARRHGADTEPDEFVSLIEAAVKGPSERLSAEAVNVLLQVMQFLHAHVVAPDSAREVPEPNNMEELFRVAREDRSLLHRLVHTLAVGKDLPATDAPIRGSVGGSSAFPIFVGWVMTEVRRASPAVSHVFGDEPTFGSCFAKSIYGDTWAASKPF